MSSPVPRPLAEVADVLLEATVVGSFSRIGYLSRRAVFGWEELPAGALDRRVVLVTGASSGLGRETAEQAARLGATVIVLGRDPERTGAARAGIAEASGSERVETVIADLARLDDVRGAAHEIAERHDTLDVIVHNAGTLTRERQMTVDGLEVTAQVHVVAPFLLTSLLLPSLGRAARPRVITVSSGGMYTRRLDLDALGDGGPEPFDGVRAYANAKRAQVVLNEQWARRCASTGIAFHALHPGWAETAGVRRSLPAFSKVMGPILRPPAEAVDTTLWLAADPGTRPSGRFWHDRHRRPVAYLPGTSTSPEQAAQLWGWCVERAGVDDPADRTVTSAPGGTR